MALVRYIAGIGCPQPAANTLRIGAVDAGTQTNDALLNAGIGVGAGLGAAWLVNRMGGRSLGKKKKNLLIPLLVVGGVGALYFMSSGTSASASTPETDAIKQNLLSFFASDPKRLVAVNQATPDELRRWNLINQLWGQGANVYAIDTSGNATSNRAASIGAWWESFSARYGGF